MLTAYTIVTVVRACIANQQTDDQIAATLEAMGFSTEAQPMDDSTDQPADPMAERRAQLEAELAELNSEAPAVPAKRNGGIRRGTEPMVKYYMAPGWTSAKIASNLVGRKFQVASVILAAGKNGATKREVLAAVAKDEPTVTDGAIMSAIHPLKADVKAIIAKPIPGARLNAMAKPAVRATGAKVR